MARPFFSYYGAKWTLAKHYGPPRKAVIVEPFAGSAAYSVRWAPEFAKLYDISEDVCLLWDFLIHCSARDIESIPDRFDSVEELLSLRKPEYLLCAFWVSKGRAEPSRTLSPWYMQHRDDGDCSVWGEAVKKRIISQKPLIEKWTIDNCSYEDIPIIDAHWHVDPPYNNSAGSKYPHSSIEYDELANWCRSLKGEVDVCENAGATWMPFEFFANTETTRGKRDASKVSREVLCRLGRSKN